MNWYGVNDMVVYGLGVVVVCYGSFLVLGELVDRGECWRGSIFGFWYFGGVLVFVVLWLL